MRTILDLAEEWADYCYARAEDLDLLGVDEPAMDWYGKAEEAERIIAKYRKALVKAGSS